MSSVKMTAIVQEHQLKNSSAMINTSWNEKEDDEQDVVENHKGD